MPAGFTRCVSRGGRVRTKRLSGKRYIRICFLGGKSFAGEVHTRKAARSTARTRRGLRGVTKKKRKRRRRK